MSEKYTLNGRMMPMGDYGAVKKKDEDRVKILPDDAVSTVIFVESYL